MQFMSSIVFYLIFSLFAFIGLPLIAKGIASKAVAFQVAKSIGFLMFGYTIWFLSSLHVLSFQRKELILFFFIVAILLGAVKSKSFWTNPSTKTGFWTYWRGLLLTETVSLTVFLGYLFIRSHNAEINGTERFMDMALLSASGKTDFFPPMDPWLSGLTVNYYYYGSYLGSLLSNLSRVPFAISYNLFLGLVFVQSVMLSGGLTYLITKSKRSAVATAFLLTLAGTLFFAGCSISKFSINGNLTSCSYPSSTRLYTPSFIINEIPSYSFTVGDLHAHLLALPIFLTFLYLIYQLLNSDKFKYTDLAVGAVVLASSAMTNMWDGVTLLSLISVAGFLKILPTIRPKVSAKTLNQLAPFAVTAVGGIVCMLPFLLNFHSPVLGLGFAPTYVQNHNLVNVQYPTPLLAQIGMWSAPLLTIVLSAWLFRRTQNKFHDNLFLQSSLILILGIIVGVEFFFIKDLYSIANPPFFRANTTFKFGYHAWTLLCVLFGVTFAQIWIKNVHFKGGQVFGLLALRLVSILVLAGGLLYPYSAWSQFYNSPKRDLDGSKWLQIQRPDDYATINYINKHIPRRAVVVEAVGDSYTHFSRITTFTGLATPMGWRSHEWTWRMEKPTSPPDANGSVETGWSKVAKISGEVEKLYVTADLREAQNILNTFKIEYLYVGDMERQTYPTLNEDKFTQLGNLVFESGNSRLYKINK